MTTVMKTVRNVENKHEMLVLFFSYKSYLSNFYRCNFKAKGIEFTSMEQFFHYKKAELFKDKQSMVKILKTDNPVTQKHLGRKVTNFNQQVWSEKSYQIMKQGLYYKFSQNPVLKELLLQIPNAKFVEASPFDTIWGIGIGIDHENATMPSKWRGLNLLGKALNEVRDSLRDVA